MSRLDDFVIKRNKIAALYDEALKDLPIIIPSKNNDLVSSRHLYIIRLKLDKLKLNHKQIFSELRIKGIGVNLHYIPIHTQPYFQQLGFKVGDFPESEKYYSEAISIPLFPQMTEEQIERVIDVLTSTLK
jgi:dTDP-4-amino-4,6-dideoxygalactose transaminase